MPSLRNCFDRLLQGAAPKVTRQELTHVERLALVRRHGDFSLAYSTAVQGNLSRDAGLAHGSACCKPVSSAAGSRS
ncbi:hypothetical protein [Mesorhizobium sp. AA22]|uniref:hypothetical protein n=1 Tax=Mesorhizobium sp. AA22 TaxID=1854057 RepID=UPI0007EE20A9|nr:hypothetical protein [Mesorhizobium sp. AA22]QIA20318.1 hypothetical protein A9K68_003405 [Mesorhizobium sp. AA22]